MPCEKPLEGYLPANGGQVRFSKPRNGRAYTKIDIPCGQCILCRLEHARQWAVRITHESTLHDENAFITLTYKDELVPEFNSLSTESKKNAWQRPQDRNHLSKFFKRLRKKIGKFRYYAVGEYGDKTQRPHYHACIFGHAFTEDRTILREQPFLLWTNPLLEEAWGNGMVSVGALNFTTAQYTAAYVTKKLTGKQQYVRLDEESGELIPLVQPRAYMSLRPAIAKNWLTPYGDQTFAHDQVVINGKAQKPPKYYDMWLKKRSEIALALIKEGREEKKKRQTPEEAKAKAINALARTKASRGLSVKV